MPRMIIIFVEFRAPCNYNRCICAALHNTASGFFTTE